MEINTQRKIFLLVSVVFIGIVTYVAADVMLSTTPPWKKKKIVPADSALLVVEGESSPNSDTNTVASTNSFAEVLSGEYYTYRVMKNETLSQIAEKFHYSMDSIKAVNNLKDAQIIENQKLKIRVRGFHTVLKNEKIELIAKRYGLEPQDLMRANNIRNAKKLWAEQVLVVPLARKK